MSQWRQQNAASNILPSPSFLVSRRPIQTCFSAVNERRHAQKKLGAETKTICASFAEHWNGVYKGPTDEHTNITYRVINCNCIKRTLYCRATIGFREVHNQFPVSNIAMVLPCISLVNPIHDLICLVKVGFNREKNQKSLILATFDGYLFFEMPPFLNALS